MTTAIANAEGKSELTASRRRIVSAADDARRQIERDLHDGIQQRLIALSFRARAMTRRPPDELRGIAAHDNGVLTLEVRDDGIGGVDPSCGSGILGLTDRVEALGGRFAVESPRGRGTTISVELPIATPATP